MDFPDINPNFYDINSMKFDFILKILSALNGEKDDPCLRRLTEFQISKLNLFELDQEKFAAS